MWGREMRPRMSVPGLCIASEMTKATNSLASSSRRCVSYGPLGEKINACEGEALALHAVMLGNGFMRSCGQLMCRPAAT